MAKISNKKIIFVLSIFVLSITIIALIFALIFPKTKPNLYDQLLTYCETNSEIKISDFTDFDWDIAYIDWQNYGNGKIITEKGIRGNFKPLESDTLYRIVFCKEDELVYDLILNVFYLLLDDAILEITPETLLSISAKSDNPKQFILKIQNNV